MKEKILIIDDHADIRDMYETVLKMKEYDVCSEPDGLHGAMKAAEWKPDVILLDLMMPQMDGFTVLDECHHMYHGEKVAFGTITQLVLENIPAEELEDIIDWCIELGLPVTLKELGITEVTDEKLMAVATAACAENDTLHNMPFEVTPETVCAAIKAADAYGKYFLGE